MIFNIIIEKQVIYTHQKI